MTGKTSYVLVGLFVLMLGLALISGILWLGSGGVGRDYDEYMVYMQESVSGLRRDNAVKFHGVVVGRVRSLDLDAERAGEVRLLLEIDSGTPVREGTVATLETQGLTGLAFINLSGGTSESPLLETGTDTEIPVIPSRPSTWGRLDNAVEELANRLISVSERFEVLLKDENLDHISRSLAKLDQLSTALAGRTSALTGAFDDMTATMQNVRHSSAELSGLVAQFRGTAGALERMANEIHDTGVTLHQAIEARDRDLQRFTGEALPEAAVMINEARRAAHNLRRFSEQLDRDPGVLLRGKAPRTPGPGE